MGDDRERDESDLRWFWTCAEGDLGIGASGDYERAAQAQRGPAKRCPACSFVGARDRGYRARRASCPRCHGLGVVVPTTIPSPSAPAAAADESVWMRFMRGADDEPVISAREHPWMALVGPMARARSRYRATWETVHAMAPRHVSALHAVYGPAPRNLDGAPLLAMVLASRNRAIDAHRLIAVQRAVGAAAKSAREDATRDADAMLREAWAAYDAARWSHDERRDVADSLAETDRNIAEAMA